MKGERLIISILIKLVLGLTITMVALNLYPSWSQYARSAEEPLLLATLSFISTVFFIRASWHPEQNRKMFNIGKMDVRMEHINRYAGFLFVGILCTPVTHPAWYIQTAHLAFTALAIGVAHSELWFYWPKGKKRNIAISVSLLGIVGFMAGFVLKLYSTGMGELLAALPIIIHVLLTNKKGL